MTSKVFVPVMLACALVSPLFAQPQLTLVPRGIENGNWVWQVDITPDFVLASEGTPMAVELGFRLTGAPLIGATNINPAEWNTPNPGQLIFGWETLTEVGPGNFRPVGLQSNPPTSEVFSAYGSIDFETPGAKPFLEIVAQGPGNGGPLSSTIEWLGVYAVGHGRIAQLVGGTAENFDTFAGTATQLVPEPATAGMLVFGCILFALRPAACRSGRGMPVEFLTGST